MTRNWSLSRRLIVGAVVWSMIMLTVTASILSVLNRNRALQLLHEELDATLLTLTRAAELTDGGEVTLIPTFAPSDERYTRALSGRYWLLARLDTANEVAAYGNSNSVWDWDVPWDDLPIDEAAEAPGQVFYTDARGPDKEPLRLAVKVFNMPGLEGSVLLVSAADRRPTDRITQNFLITLTISMIILAIGLIVAMVILVRLGLKPITRIEHDVADIRTGDRDKLDDNYPQEIAPLAVELNKLIDHNRSVVERARTHVGNLAHALKTPIAVLMNEAKGDEPLARLVRRQTEAMSQNVQHYLKRAQAAARAEILGARAEIAPAIDDLIRLLQRLYEHDGITVLPGHVDETICFRGERQDLEEMLGNLMENACKFAKSKVRVTGERSADSELVIHVDDDGPGLTEEERKEALKRGVRLDETAPGTGLGLSIVKDLAELYSGRIELSDAPLGGLRATLYLPIARSRQAVS